MTKVYIKNDEKCNNCGSSVARVEVSGPHNKLVCNDCNTFLKFISKKRT